MTNRTADQVAKLLRRGLNHYGSGDVTAAIACWEKAVEIEPDNRAARDYLNTAYQEMGASSGAEVEVEVEPEPEPESGADLGASIPDAPRDTTLPGPVSEFTDFDLGEPPTAPSTASDPDVEKALEAYRGGQLEEAWMLLEEVSEAQPDRLDVQGYRTMIRGERARRWVQEIGDQGRAIKRSRPMQELMKLNLKPDEGFLLSQIDGELSIEELLTLSSSDRVRTLEILARFLREGWIS